MPETPLITYLRIQQATDRQVLAALRTSATAVSGELRRLQAATRPGGVMRREQLLMSQAAINRELEVLYSRVGDTVRASAASAAAAGAETILRESEGLLKNVLSDADYDYLRRSAMASASRSLEVLRQRVSGTSYVPLAESVWRNQRWSNSTVNRMVNDALARGASAAELAKEVRDFVNPNTPGGVRYASMRLARTELNNAFHAAQVKQAQEEPWVLAVRWHLSGSHPVPDECNDYAEKEHFDGGGAGLWKKDEVPSKPHPNCLCYTTPETPDREQFIDAYLDGRYDDYLEANDVDPAPAPERPAPQKRKPSRPVPRTQAAPPAPAPPRSGYTVDESQFDDIAFKDPESYETALSKVNPLATRQEYLNNCHFVVNAMEMRARGYQVYAAPTYQNTGRFNPSIAKDWIDPQYRMSGQFTPIPPSVRELTGAAAKRGAPVTSKAAVEVAAKDWPPGARGFIRGSWERGGGAHIFNLYKDEKGVLRFVDGQVAKKDASSYLLRMKDIQIMRVDNLEPRASRVRGAVQPVWPGRGPAAITPEVELDRAKFLLEQLEEDIQTVPRWYRNVYQKYIDNLRGAVAVLETKVKRK